MRQEEEKDHEIWGGLGGWGGYGRWEIRRPYRPYLPCRPYVPWANRLFTSAQLTTFHHALM